MTDKDIEDKQLSSGIDVFKNKTSSLRQYFHCLNCVLREYKRYWSICKQSKYCLIILEQGLSTPHEPYCDYFTRRTRGGQKYLRVTNKKNLKILENFNAI